MHYSMMSNREHLSQIFKNITIDNGSEVADFVQVAKWKHESVLAHPYTSWDRPQNERHNALFRAFVQKGASIEQYTDKLIGRLRKKFGYRRRLREPRSRTEPAAPSVIKVLFGNYLSRVSNLYLQFAAEKRI